MILFARPQLQAQRTIGVLACVPRFLAKDDNGSMKLDLAHGRRLQISSRHSA
jgi:hypothetical protein